MKFILTSSSPGAPGDESFTFFISSRISSSSGGRFRISFYCVLSSCPLKSLTPNNASSIWWGFHSYLRSDTAARCSLKAWVVMVFKGWLELPLVPSLHSTLYISPSLPSWQALVHWSMICYHNWLSHCLRLAFTSLLASLSSSLKGFYSLLSIAASPFPLVSCNNSFINRIPFSYLLVDVSEHPLQSLLSS